MNTAKDKSDLKIDNYGEILGNNNPNTLIKEILSKEIKGLDVVRRDWCVLSKDVGYKLLELILSQRQRDDIVTDIYDFMNDLGKKFKENRIPLEQFVIYKQ